MKKVLLIVIGSIVAVIAILFAVGATMISNFEMDTSPEGLLAFEMEVSKEVAMPIYNALESVGIDYIASIEHDELLDNAYGNGEIGYRVGTLNIDNVILYLNADSSVHQIKYANNILYENDQAIAKIEDYYLTDKQRETLIVNIQEEVKKLLKSPSTAEFPSSKEWFINKVDGITTVQGYVDAQNGFGAMLRSEFLYTIEDNTITSLIFDGEEYIKQ